MTNTAPDSPADAQTSVVARRVTQAQSYRGQVKGMPREAVRGYPVPFVFEREIYLAFPFFLRRGLPPNPPQVGPFRWIVTIDAATGSRRSSRAIDGDTSVVLGEHRIEPAMSMSEFTRVEQRMYSLMSDLLPIVVSAPMKVPPTLASQAMEFAALWKQLSHEPLAEAYRSLNPEWFDALGL